MKNSEPPKSSQDRYLHERHLRAQDRLDRLNAECARSQRALTALRSFTDFSMRTLDPKALFRSALLAISQFSQCKFIVAYQQEERSRDYVILSSHLTGKILARPPQRIEGIECEYFSKLFPADDLSPSPVSLTIADEQTGPLSSFLKQSPATTPIAIPIRAGNLHFGMILIGMADKPELAIIDDAFLATMACQVSAAVERMKFFDAFHQIEKLSTLGEIIAGIVHELNNPLTAVLGFSELLAQANMNERSNEMARTVYHEALRSKRIVENLLDFAKRRSSEESRVDVHNLIGKALELTAYESRVNNIRVKRRFAPGMENTAGNPFLLEQVFFNVITNAQQAMSKHGDSGELTISTELLQESIVIRFRDTGPGIPKEIENKIFEPFFTTKSPARGTGLGLSLCHKIMERHGGTIRYESSPEGSAIFIITLPLVKLPPISNNIRMKKELSSSPHPGNILIIDDESAILELLTEILRRHHHTVTATEDGSRALEFISAKPFDCIICDVKMPAMSGQEFTRQIQEINPEMAERLIFITGDFMSDSTKSFLKQSGIPYIKKPFIAAEICNLVNQIIAGIRK
jgi:signal transduction histidine kinase/CheY-like chemotaxis protein